MLKDKTNDIGNGEFKFTDKDNFVMINGIKVLVEDYSSRDKKDFENELSPICNIINTKYANARKSGKDPENAIKLAYEGKEIRQVFGKNVLKMAKEKAIKASNLLPEIAGPDVYGQMSLAI